MSMKRTIILTTVVITLATLSGLALIIQAERIKGPRRYIFSIDSKGIYRSDSLTNESELIFDTQGMYGVSFSVSPADTLIAILVTEPGYTPPGVHDYAVLPKNSLLFIDVDGNRLTTLKEDVRKYSWSPDGGKVAYIAGTYYEGGVGFKSTGAGIFDLKSGSITKIKKDFPHQTIKGTDGETIDGVGYDINWARHDSNIYIQDFSYLGGVYRYNTKAGLSEDVQYHGIGFSPDGRYYLSVIPEDATYLFHTASNKNITDRVKSRFGYLPQSWIPQEDHHLLMVKIEYEPSPIDTVKNDKPRLYLAKDRKIRQKTFFIYDVDQDQITKEWIEKP